MKTFLKILLAALLLMPALALATTSAPWSITNLTDTFVFPNLINGSAKGVLVSASSTFNGNLSVSTLTSGNCVQAGAGGLLTTVVGACGSGTGSTFGTTSLSAVAPLQYSQSPLAQFSITQAGTGGNGYLSSVDFNTFNNKISSTSLSVTTTGTSGAATYTPATGVFNIPQYATAPGGLNLHVQYNNAGSFGGISGAVTDGTILNLTNPLLGGATLTTSVVNGVTLSSAGSATTYLNGTGAYSVPVGTVYTGTFPIQVTSSVISSLFSTTSNSGLAAGNLYVGSGGIFQTSASSSIFGFTPVAPTRAINTTYPLQGGGDLSADRTLTFGGLGTTTPWIQGQLAYVVNGNTLTSTATTSVTCTGNASCSPFAVLGASPITINVAAGTAASSTLLGDSNTFSGVLNKFSNPISISTFGGLIAGNSGLTYSAATSSIGAGTGLSFSGTSGAQVGGTNGTFSVNTTQNITTLSNLTTAGTVNTTASGVLYSTATSTPTVTAPITYSGTLGSFIGGSSGTFACASCLTANQTITLTGAVTGSGSTAITTAFGTAGANTFLANATGATAVPTFVSTSTIFGTPTPGSILAFLNGVWVGAATTTFSSGLAYLNGNVTNTGVTSNVAGTGISVSGATGAVTVTNTGVTSIVAGTNITVSGATGAVTINATGGGSSFGYPFTPSTDGNINTSATSTALEGTARGIGLDVPVTSWYGLGGQTLAYASTTNQDTIFGIRAGGTTATTSATVTSETAVGQNALAVHTTSIGDTAVGFNAGARITSNPDNTLIGYEAGQSLTSDTFGQNTFIGSNAGINTSGGEQNSSIGYNSLSGSGSPIGNSALGYNAGDFTSGNYSVFIGANAGFFDGTGSDNIFIGSASTSANANITTGSQNVIIGANIAAPIAAGSDQLNVQNIIFGTGNGAIGSKVSSGNIGVGTTTPYAKFSVFGGGNYSAQALTTLFAVGSTTAGTATTTLFYIQSSGQVFAPKLTTSGSTQTDNLCLSSTFEVISDTAACVVSAQRFKENIDALDNDKLLSEVLKLQPVSFNYKPDFNGALQSNPNYSTQQVGFVADAVQKIDPRLVTVETATTSFEGKAYGPGVVQSVRYENMTALLAGAIQAQQREIASLKPAAKSAEDNWQWFVIDLLVLWNIGLTVRRKK